MWTLHHHLDTPLHARAALTPPPRHLKPREQLARLFADFPQWLANTVTVAESCCFSLDEIRYRYAETYFNAGEWKTSISEFNKVTNNHPTSPWKCWAFYKIGEAFEHLNQPEGAKAFFKGATEDNCKSSDAAKEARKKF